LGGVKPASLPYRGIRISVFRP